jgi:hypothetical protein
MLREVENGAWREREYGNLKGFAESPRPLLGLDFSPGSLPGPHFRLIGTRLLASIWLNLSWKRVLLLGTARRRQAARDCHEH